MTAVVPEVAFGNVPNDTSPTYVDLSARFRRLSIRRGRSRELDRFTPGTLTAVLRNQDRALEPEYSSGTYYPNVDAMKPIRVRTTTPTGTLFTGFVEQWEAEWARADGWVTVSAVDALADLAIKKLNTGRGYPAAVLADGATSYWRMGEAPGASFATDATGNGHSAYTVGTVIFTGPPTNGDRNGALFLDPDGCAYLGDTDGWFSPPGAAAITGNAAFTIEAWINPTLQTVWSTDNTIWEQSDSAASSAGVVFYIDAITRQLGVELIDNSISYLYQLVSTSTFPTDGLWHHVAVTRAGDGRTVRLYIDGVLDNTGVAGSALTLITTPCAIGGRTVTPQSGRWHGRIDEVAVYQGLQLSTAQLLSHYNLGASNFVSGEGPSSRIGKILDAVGIPSALYSLEAGSAALQAITNGLMDQTSLDVIQQVVDSEQDGRFFADRNNILQFQGQSHSVGAAIATFGDGGGGELTYALGVPKGIKGVTGLYNEIPLQRVNGVLQVAKDATSQTKYRVRSMPPKTNLLNTTDAAVAALAAHILAKVKDTQLRFDQIVLNPLGDSRLWFQLANRDLGDLITLIKRPPGGGAAIVKDQRIEGISHDAEPSGKNLRFQTAWAVSPA